MMVSLSIMVIYISLMFLPQKRSCTMAISQMKYKLVFLKKTLLSNRELKVYNCFCYIFTNLFSKYPSTTVLYKSYALPRLMSQDQSFRYSYPMSNVIGNNSIGLYRKWMTFTLLSVDVN
jgi:hypothetical protein